MTWLISKALMNSLCSQEQVAEFLGDTSSDGEQCVQSSGNPIPQAYCAPDKMKVFSRLSQFGMTYKPLMENLGEGLSMSSVVDFHVRTLVRQEKVSESMEKDQECGEKWRGSFVKWDHDSSLWKTHQCSLLGDLELFSETWPQWGLMRNGECWEQQMLAQTIRGTESGSGEKLPTPTASDYKNQPTSASWKAKGAINYKLSNPEIQAKWATPTTMDSLPPKSAQALHKEATQARPGRSKPANLRDQVSNMHMWPTPVHSEARQGLQIRREGKKGSQTSLTTAVMTWPTPRTKGMCGGSGSWDLLNKNTTVEEARLMGAGNGGQLNPTWVEWLMGFPLGWTDLRPLEMHKSHSVPQQLGES